MFCAVSSVPQIFAECRLSIEESIRNHLGVEAVRLQRLKKDAALIAECELIDHQGIASEGFPKQGHPRSHKNADLFSRLRTFHANLDLGRNTSQPAVLC